MVEITPTVRRVFKVYERFDHGDGEQAVLGEIRDSNGRKSYRLDFSNHSPEFGPMVVWTKNDEPLYWVTCGPTGEAESCTCPSFKFKRGRAVKACKHMEATTALIRENVFRMGE
jgi:hypothetical protein